MVTFPRDGNRRQFFVVTRLVAVAVGLCISAGSVAAADDVWGAIRVPGGADALRRVASLGDGPRIKAGVLADLIRAQYRNTSEGAEEARDRLKRYLEHMLAVEQAVADWPDGLVLAAATGADRRRQETFRDAVELFGLRVRTNRGQATVEVDRGGESVERQQWLAAARISATSIAERLNAGDAVRITVPSDEVPLPLPAAWASQVFRPGTDPLVQFVTAPRSNFTYLGLSRLDRDTLSWIASRPDVFKKIVEDRAPVFGGFSHGLRVREGRVLTPGGDSAVAIWERLVDAPVTDPARFVDRLFEKDDGRLAYFYSAVAGLDSRRQDFVLGAKIVEKRPGRDRVEYVDAIRDWFTFANPTWSVTLQPLFRPPIDPALVLSIVDVDEAGLAGPDWWPSLLQRVADNNDWPERQRDTLDRLKSAPAHANWLLYFVFDKPSEADERWAWVRFAQRRLAAAPRAAAPDVEIALRALKEMPVLALALERLGVADPAVYADVARAARRLSAAGGPDEVTVAMRTWQGALSTLEQVARHRPIPGDVVAKLLTSLAASVPAKPLSPSGQVAGWALHTLLPALGAGVGPGDEMEDAVIGALLAADAQPAATFDWDGVAYRVDVRGPVLASALSIREVMPGPRLQHLSVLDAAAARLAQPFKTLEEVGAVAEELESVLPAWNGGDLADAVRDLRRIRAVKDVARASRQRNRVLVTLDEMASDILPGLAYALALSPSSQPPRVFAEIARIHELAFKETGGKWQSSAWDVGSIANRTAGGTAVRGSLLGLDLVVAPDLLSRAPGSVGRPASAGGAIQEITQGILVDRIVMRAPLEWTTRSADAAAAIAKGRTRFATWRTGVQDGPAFSEELRRAGFSQARENQLRWLLDRKDDAALDGFMTITDFYRLGSPDELPAGWGQSARLFDGCWCVRGVDREPVDRFLGYSTGYVAAALSDLSLRLAEILAGMRVPASVIEPVLPFAVQDVLDQAAQFLPDDWEALSWAGRLTPERVEDYLQALVSRRVLAPPSDPGGRKP